MAGSLPGGGNSAFDAIKKDSANAWYDLKRREDELARAERTKLKIEERKISSHLPSSQNLAKALVLAVFADVVGIFFNSSSALMFGVFFDAAIIIILSMLLKEKPTDLKNIMIFIFEIIPISELFFWYTVTVLFLYLKHRSEYGTLSEIVHSLKEMKHSKGIFEGASINLSGIGFVWAAILIIVPGCMVIDLSTTEHQDFNLIGNGAQNFAPYKAFKESGTLEGFREQATVKAFNWQWEVDPMGWLEGFLNQSTAIAGRNYYEGEIEETQGLDLGLEISGIQFLGNEMVGDPVEMSYFVTGGTFTETETEAKPFCYIKKPSLLNNNQVEGVTEPESFEMIKNFPVNELVFCGIETQGLDKGQYQAFAGVEYEFEVWSYIPYTFAKESSLGTNDLSSVAKKTNSLDTAGPMQLTISELAQNIDQPYIIRDERDSNFLVNFKLVNRDKGKLKELYYVILQVPEEFDAKCFRDDNDWEQNSDTAKAILSAQILNSESAKGNYDFDLSFLDDKNIILLTGFTSEEVKKPEIDFRCSLTLNKNKDIFDGISVKQETIVATTKYVYAVEAVSSVELKEGIIS